MSVTTYEGIVEEGQIKLNPDISIPEQTKVYVIIPNEEAPNLPRLVNPRLAHPEQIIDFKMEVIESSIDVLFNRLTTA